VGRRKCEMGDRAVARHDFSTRQALFWRELGKTSLEKKKKAGGGRRKKGGKKKNGGQWLPGRPISKNILSSSSSSTDLVTVFGEKGGKERGTGSERGRFVSGGGKKRAWNRLAKSRTLFHKGKLLPVLGEIESAKETKEREELDSAAEKRGISWSWPGTAESHRQKKARMQERGIDHL